MCMLRGLFMATIHYVQDFEQEKNRGGGKLKFRKGLLGP